ncbi:nucleotidyltransferase family protein [Alphaproteobacteria bacterium]|nr:nucleotidyltransferase family protein [Alphaproteobacteria bacterium]
MKMVVLAAGYGTRLAPLTDTVPKCLVDLDGLPLLQYWLEAFEDCDRLTELVVNTHYLSKRVYDFLENWHSQKSITLTFEPELLGTAGTIRSLSKWVGSEPLLVVHGDNFSSINLTQFIDSHMSRPFDSIGTMAYFTCENPHACGIIEIDSLGKVVSFLEKPERDIGRSANAAVYVFEPEALLEFFKCDLATPDISLDIIPKLIGKLFSYEISGFHVDVGSVSAYRKAQAIASSLKKTC